MLYKLPWKSRRRPVSRPVTLQPSIDFTLSGRNEHLMKAFIYTIHNLCCLLSNVFVMVICLRFPALY